VKASGASAWNSWLSSGRAVSGRRGLVGGGTLMIKG